jgi:hypothetical protein
MRRTIVSLDDYVRLINNKLREHPLFRPGMRVARGQDALAPRTLIFIGAREVSEVSPFVWAQSQIDLAYQPHAEPLAQRTGAPAEGG